MPSASISILDVRRHILDEAVYQEIEEMIDSEEQRGDDHGRF
jgi:hypothetical protein